MSGPAAGAATSKSREYDVFINHRGPDVKKTFVAHLHAALISGGFRPFVDAEDIAYALPVFDKIDKALKGACVHVAIFSKGYAESIHCLDELCEMLKSEQRIIPVFYDVEVEDLRRIKDGPYKEAFKKHQKRGRTEKIPIWKEALCKVADYRGFRTVEVNGNEHQLIRRILVEVRNALPPNLLPGKRFGLEKSMKDVVKTLESASVIGLVGMGGIGKTTLAMDIYNHFLSCQRFEDYCFLRDVRSSQTSVLQEKVLRDLGLGSESRCNDQEYRRTLNSALKHRRVLVIVDDISDANQFEALIPEILIIPGLDCRIVITSRRHDVLKHVMKALPAASKAVYEVQMLENFDSRRLFNIHAFMSETPSEGFVELAATIADACRGLPLSLEVMGGYLFDKEKPEDKEIWLEAVKALQENPEIIDKLRVCYDGLPTDGDRAMFRDIACMLIGVQKEVAMTIWKSCKNCDCSSSKTPVSSLRNLMDRSLVKLDKDDTLRMHDVLRDMGRQIVTTDAVKGQPRPREEWTHLWDPVIAEKELSREKVNTKARGICLTVTEQDEHLDEELDYFHNSTISCEASKLGSMKELHLLRLDGCNVVQDDFSRWSQQLRWLQWRLYRFESFPPQLKVPHLVVLDLSYSFQLTCLWEQNVHMMVNLAQLVVLDLTNCYNLTCLWENDAHIQLPLLQVLRLVHCHKVGLPKHLGKSLPKLKRLEMRDCVSLRTLPNSIGLLTELEHLDLHGCYQIITLPNAIVELVSLRTFILSNCEKLKELPMELGRLINLEELDVSEMRSLSNFPVNIGGLKKLKKLEMKGTMVRHLPTDFGLLTSLRSLSTDILDSVPVAFDGLKTLTHLCVDEKSKDLDMRLTLSLGAFTALQFLHLSSFERISHIPQSLGNLKCLVKVIILKWKELLIIEALPQCLELLNLEGCRNLIEIPSLMPMKSLVHLNLMNCQSLRNIHGLECITTLEYINVMNCTLIEDHGVNINKDNKALGECYLTGSKVGVAYNNRWLEDEPSQQFISYWGDRIPSCLPNGIADPVSGPVSPILVAEATISRKAECIVITWCSTFQTESQYFVNSIYVMRFKILRGGKLAMESHIFLPSVRLDASDILGNGIICVLTLRRKHRVVEAVKPGDRLCVYIDRGIDGFFTAVSIMLEVSIYVVYNEVEHLLLEVNSELLSKDASQELAIQFGDLVLEDESRRKRRRESGVCRALGFTSPTRKRGSNANA